MPPLIGLVYYADRVTITLIFSPPFRAAAAFVFADFLLAILLFRFRFHVSSLFASYSDFADDTLLRRLFIFDTAFVSSFA